MAIMQLANHVPFKGPGVGMKAVTVVGAFEDAFDSTEGLGLIEGLGSTACFAVGAVVCAIGSTAATI
jgi:hypothetical protein